MRDQFMQTEKDHLSKQTQEVNDTAIRNGEAVAELYKALKASFFYPEKHPLRNDILNRAFNFLSRLMNGSDFSLVITRNGFSASEGGMPVASSLMTKALARELFLREIQRLSFLPDLSFQELQDFLSLLTVDPQKIVAAGGMEKLLAEKFIRNIITNAIDISAVFTKRYVSDAEDAAPLLMAGEIQSMAVETGFAPPDLMDLVPTDNMADMDIDAIIAAMETEPADSRYLLLAELLSAKAQPLKEQNQFDLLVPLVIALLNQGLDPMRSQSRRDAALAAFEQIASGEMTGYLLFQLENRGYEGKDTAYLILQHLGEKAVPEAIQRLNSAGSIHSRKALATALARIGKPAVPSLLAMLNDAKWFRVRAMLTILGEIGCRDSIEGLKHTIYHDDDRVRKEAIRCLTKIGGTKAAEILVELLSDKDSSILKQVIFSLGILKDDVALDPLIRIAEKRDIFLKSLQLKKEALQSIGVLGNRRVLPNLEKLAWKRYWFAPKRGGELRVSATAVIGQLGNESSLEFLRKLSSKGGQIGRACKAAANSINQRIANKP
jgi:HEAT repeat protein